MLQAEIVSLAKDDVAFEAEGALQMGKKSPFVMVYIPDYLSTLSGAVRACVFSFSHFVRLSLSAAICRSLPRCLSLHLSLSLSACVYACVSVFCLCLFSVYPSIGVSLSICPFIAVCALASSLARR